MPEQFCIERDCTVEVHARHRCATHYRAHLRELGRRGGQTQRPAGFGRLAAAAPTIAEMERRLHAHGGYQPTEPLTGRQLLDRVWGREAARA